VKYGLVRDFVSSGLAFLKGNDPVSDVKIVL